MSSKTIEMEVSEGDIEMFKDMVYNDGDPIEWGLGDVNGVRVTIKFIKEKDDTLEFIKQVKPGQYIKINGEVCVLDEFGDLFVGIETGGSWCFDHIYDSHETLNIECRIISQKEAKESL